MKQRLSLWIITLAILLDDIHIHLDALIIM